MTTNNQTQLDHLQAQSKDLHDEFDTLCYRSECGIEIDMNRWYQLIAQINRVEERIGLLRTQDGIDRADILIDELRELVNDPFEPQDSQPELEIEYDPWMEQKQMESELRRGEG
jgi:hypothetical protein